jgi:hypothetical protein
MFGRRRLAGFCLRFLLWYALLMAPWPGVQRAYRVGFTKVGELVFGSFGSPGAVRFEALDDQQPIDVAVYLRLPRADGGVKTVRTNTRGVGYFPTVVAASLILATPIPWSRRGRALFWGLVLVNVFVGVRLAIVLAYGWYYDSSAEPTLWSRTALTAVAELSSGRVGSYLGPILIWIAVSFRRGDRALLLDKFRR